MIVLTVSPQGLAHWPVRLHTYSCSSQCRTLKDRPQDLIDALSRLIEAYQALSLVPPINQPRDRGVLMSV
jgi:hypothetical protein